MADIKKMKNVGVGVWAILGPILVTALFFFGRGWAEEIKSDINEKANKEVVEVKIENLQQTITEIKTQVKDSDVKLDNIMLMLVEMGK